MHACSLVPRPYLLRTKVNRVWYATAKFRLQRNVSSYVRNLIIDNLLNLLTLECQIAHACGAVPRSPKETRILNPAIAHDVIAELDSIITKVLSSYAHEFAG